MYNSQSEMFETYKISLLFFLQPFTCFDIKSMHILKQLTRYIIEFRKVPIPINISWKLSRWQLLVINEKRTRNNQENFKRIQSICLL